VSKDFPYKDQIEDILYYIGILNMFQSQSHTVLQTEVVFLYIYFYAYYLKHVFI